MTGRGFAPDSGVVRILELAAGVLEDLDLDAVLERVLAAARELTGARYAALGVLDRLGSGLERFLTVGIDEETRRRIGPLPLGRGVLGELIKNPAPLRVADVGSHPASYGFPTGHPDMRTFLGVPVFVGDTPFGNLYLTEKADGAEFTEEDEQALVRLARIAGIAIDHARRFGGVQARRSELERTVAALDATVQIAKVVSGETDLGRILELVAKRGRALVSARAVVVEHEERGEMVVAAGAGELPSGLIAQSVDLRDSLAAAALRSSTTLRIEDEPNRLRFERHGLGKLGLRAEAGLIVPLLFHGRGYGVLVAVDRQIDGPSFTRDDQRLLEAFAASAATAIANARNVQAERRSQRLAAAEQERARWARELHDETLQNLAALRIAISLQLRSGTPDTATEVMGDAVDELHAEIEKLRALITDLRPTALDDVGLEPAIEDLAERARARGLDVTLSIDLAYERGRERTRHTPELETALYRITQEGLNNSLKHASATEVRVEISESTNLIELSVRDDGKGFDPVAETEGIGLQGMRERAELLGAAFEINSAPGQGTEITLSVPTQRRHEELAS